VEIAFRVLRSPNEWAGLREEWDAIVKRESPSILGLDVTATSTWAEMLWENHLNHQGLELLVGESAGKLQALFPFYRIFKSVHSVPCRSIAPITELYSGRCGFLLREFSSEALQIVLNGLREHVSDWDVCVFSLVENSRSSQLFAEFQQQTKLRSEKLFSQCSPYIVLDKPWEVYFASLPKKFRWNLRNFEKRMRAAGEVIHRVFEQGSNLDQFHCAVQEIEKASWKEEAGTSLTANVLQESFHVRLMRGAAERGWFSGHVLEFRGEPVSYVWGLLYGNIFYDFKESYKSAHQHLGPGHVLKLSLMEQLFKRGVAFYDYMGLCEEYKLRWTDKTYERSTFILYNSTLAARAARLGSRIKKTVSATQTNHP
jgi:hypothetical protein